MPPTLDASAVRDWCRLSLRALGGAREEIDAINVYPVADGDTGTNLYLTFESAARAVEAAFDGHAATAGPAAAGGPGTGEPAAAVRGAGGEGPTRAETLRALCHGALIGARGNSGTILAQLLRGMNESLSEEPDGGGPPPGGPTTADPAAGGAGTGRARAGGADSASVGGGGIGEAGGDRTAEALRRALRSAADSAYEAVARPVEGTMLTVACAAADAAERAAGGADDVVRAAHAGALAALADTPGQLDALGRAGVVDAGGLGLVAVLGALCEAVTGQAPPGPPPGAAAGSGTSFRHEHGSGTRRPGPEPGSGPGSAPGGDSGRAHGRGAVPAPEPVPVLAPGPEPDPGRRTDPVNALPDGGGEPDTVPGTGEAAPGEVCGHGGGQTGDGGPAFEVVFLLESARGGTALDRMRTRLDALGDSLVVVGGDGLWHVHVHVDDVGAAIEAGIEAGRPHRIRVTHFGEQAGRTGRPRSRRQPAERVVVAVVEGDGLAALYAQAGASVVPVRPGEPPAGGELAGAIRRAHAREVVLLPNDAELRHAAEAAAQQARADGVRVALIPTRSAVQGLAALAVHEPSRRFDEDVVAMTSAAGATRYAELAVAERQSWTMAGVCQAGDVLGLIDGDVAVIGSDLAATAAAVLDRMLAAGGELVTLVSAAATPPDLTAHLQTHVRDAHLAVDTVTYEGGEMSALLTIGVE